MTQNYYFKILKKLSEMFLDYGHHHPSPMKFNYSTAPVYTIVRIDENIFENAVRHFRLTPASIKRGLRDGSLL